MAEPSDLANEDDLVTAELVGDPPLAPDDTDVSVSPSLPTGAIWGEVGAVLAIGVIPHILNAGILLRLPSSPPPPQWLDAIQLTVMSGCTTFVTLYLIHRSGESWKRFGLPRSSLWDVLLGVGLLLASEALWFCCGIVTWGIGATSDYQFPRLEVRADFALLVPKYGFSAFSEELVTRAYLITRLEQLLRSRGAALLVSALLFASYHGYQGVAGLIYTLAFGLMYGMAFLLLRRIWPLAIAHALFNIHLELASQNWPGQGEI